MKRILHEPLVHFLLLGGTLFGLYAALNPSAKSKPGEVVVTAGQVDHLASTFSKLWQRPPTASELKGLIDQYVKEEIFSREAIKLGLDQNDTVIRRRLEQKMEFIAEDTAAANEPTDADLSDYLAKHPKAFQEEPRFTFRQVFLNSEKRGDRVTADAQTLLTNLNQYGATAALDSLGDSFLLPTEINDQSQSRVASQFGDEFAAAIAKLPAGKWSGPVRSGYGLHLVCITRYTEGRLPTLDEVRPQVKRELMNERRLAANQKFLDNLLANYRVTIQWPRSEPVSEQQATAMNR